MTKVLKCSRHRHLALDCDAVGYPLLRARTPGRRRPVSRGSRKAGKKTAGSPGRASSRRDVEISGSSGFLEVVEGIEMVPRRSRSLRSNDVERGYNLAANLSRNTFCPHVPTTGDALSAVVAGARVRAKAPPSGCRRFAHNASIRCRR